VVRRSFKEHHKAVQKCFSDFSEWGGETAAMSKGQLLFGVQLREPILLEWDCPMDTYFGHLQLETEFHQMEGIGSGSSTG